MVTVSESPGFIDRLTTDGRSSRRKNKGIIAPPVDLYALDDDVVACIDLPGIDSARDLEISVLRDKVVVSGERRNLNVLDAALLTELNYGRFQREISLPSAVDASDVEADYTNGVLTLTIRGVAHPAEPQRVQVLTGQKPISAPQEEAVYSEDHVDLGTQEIPVEETQLQTSFAKPDPLEREERV